MKRLEAMLAAATFALTVLATGCGGDEAEKMASLSKEACACKDRACYDKVNEKWRDMEKGLEKKYPKKSDAPKELLEAYKKHRGAMRDCRDKLE